MTSRIVRRAGVSLVVILTIVAMLCLFSLWREGGGPAGVLMSELEQASVFGGEGSYELCQVPQLGGSECSQDDTYCTVGDDYCAQEQVLHALCADTKSYQNPVRCLPANTNLCCDDENVDNGTVVCYTYSLCGCEIEFVNEDPIWVCVDETSQPDGMVTKCTVSQCPAGT